MLTCEDDEEGAEDVAAVFVVVDEDADVDGDAEVDTCGVVMDVSDCVGDVLLKGEGVEVCSGLSTWKGGNRWALVFEGEGSVLLSV